MAKMFWVLVAGIVGVLLLGMVAGTAFAADPTPTPAPPARGWCCPGRPGPGGWGYSGVGYGGWDGSGNPGADYGGWGYGGWGR